MDYQRFIWQETAPGKYEREVDEAEQFYTSVAKTYAEIGHTVFAITACISLKVALPVNMAIGGLDEKIDDSFRRAWKEMLFDHPTLAAPVVYDTETKKCKKVYQSPATELDLDNWLRDTFTIIDDGQTGEEFANTDPPVGPLAKLYIVKPAQNNPDGLSRDIVFRSSHDMIDGLGSFYLLNNFLLYASSAFSSSNSFKTPTIGDRNEVKNLSPPFRVAANVPPTPNASQSSKLAETRALNNILASTPDITVLSLPYSTHSPTPGNSQRTAILLTEPQTKAIVSACKERGITPTQAVHSSIALALAELQPATEAPRSGRYISYSLINLRKHCVAPYDTAKHAASAYHCASGLRLGIDVAISASPPGAGTTEAVERKEEQTEKNEAFESALEQMKKFSQDTRVDEDFISTVPSLFASVTPPYPSSPIPLAYLPLNKSPSISLSSLGIINQIIQSRYDAFEVVSPPWVVGGEYNTGYGLFLGTWSGRLVLNAAYNESFHGRAEVQAFLRRVTGIVSRGLGVKEE
ncbi:hypothetical protein GLAREA_01292 [Glarea lozoyensis ATCC 20868]|uniref:Uncharacterized protein n=1 Tax=Glarea lozoyensis (strain ATCC 20868 / MF5171) TaxID=1116229 RepID=S3CHQ3_GLAL2|nr:uncharacterized protein GLAREA_01292 [Glarea lozoyensis ATCC 20868]EPE25380.1 hypothetical protein GLAREA_01292 [Glarea lozoyensis ATCC 20868]